MNLHDELLESISGEVDYAEALRVVSARLDDVDRAGELFFGRGVPDREGLTRTVLRAHFAPMLRLDEESLRSSLVHRMCELLGWERVVSLCVSLANDEIKGCMDGYLSDIRGDDDHIIVRNVLAALVHGDGGVHGS